MKKFLVVMLVCLTVLQTGCVYQGHYRPKLSDEAVWVCENPKMEYYCSETRDLKDVIYINGEKRFADYSFSMGRVVIIEEALEEESEKIIGDKFFKGEANFKKDRFDIKVTEDYVNLFGGELPTLRFEKRDIDEYFAEIEKAN